MPSPAGCDAPLEDMGRRRTPRRASPVTPFLDHVFGTARRALWLLMGAVVLVLVIACANVAGLLVARNALRSREFAVRRALGATPWQLIRQSLVEAGVLAAAGGMRRHGDRGPGSWCADRAQSGDGRAAVRDAGGFVGTRRMSADHRGGDARRCPGPGDAVEPVRRDRLDERAVDARPGRGIRSDTRRVSRRRVRWRLR